MKNDCMLSTGNCKWLRACRSKEEALKSKNHKKMLNPS